MGIYFRKKPEEMPFKAGLRERAAAMSRLAYDRQPHFRHFYGHASLYFTRRADASIMLKVARACAPLMRRPPARHCYSWPIKAALLPSA